MIYQLGFDKETINVEIPENNVMDVLHPRNMVLPESEFQIIREALDNPIGTTSFKELFKPGEKIAIITSDITRPCPSWKILPSILSKLEASGIQKDDITVIFALGSHRIHSREEMEKLVGKKIFSNYKCLNHEKDQCKRLGYTSKGTPVDLNKKVIEADRRILVGNIEYHYFAGYSGGIKALFPGVSSFEAIQANHSMMTMDGAIAGNLVNNPVRDDLEEIAQFIDIDMLINVVLGPSKEILKAFAGHYILAHREGCRFLDSLYRIPVERAADIVLVSAGGFPKDINIYQAQKALDNAVQAVRKGGVIIWVASCREGYGSEVFQRWIEESTSPKDILRRVKDHFELGGHKAAAIMKAREKAHILFVSNLPPLYGETMFLNPFPSVEKALAEAFNICGKQSTILLMPFGGSTLPDLLSAK